MQNHNFPVVLYGYETWCLTLRIETEGIGEQSAEENSSTEEGLNNRRLEKTA
jgi:hypothetical protein